MGFLSDLFQGVVQGAPQMAAGYTGGLVRAKQAQLQQAKLEEDRALRRELAKAREADAEARRKSEEDNRKARTLTMSLDRLDRDLRNMDRLSEYDRQRLLPNMKRQRATYRTQLGALGIDIAPMFDDEDDFLPAPEVPEVETMATPSVLQPKLEMPLPPGQLQGVKFPEGMPSPFAGLRDLIPRDLLAPVAEEAPTAPPSPSPVEEPERRFLPSEKTAQQIATSKAQEGFYGARAEEIRTLTPERLNNLIADTGLKMSKTETEELMRDPRYEKELATIEKLEEEARNLRLKPGFDERRVRTLEKQAGIAAGRLAETIRHNRNTEGINALRTEIYRSATQTDRAYKRKLMQKVDAQIKLISDGLSPAQRLQYQTAARLLVADIMGLGVNTLTDTERAKLRKTVDGVHGSKGLPSLFEGGELPGTPEPGEVTSPGMGAITPEELTGVDELFQAKKVVETIRYWDKADPVKAKRLRRAIQQRKGKTFEQLFGGKTK